MTADASSSPRWRGINHLALVTPDMDATVRFYHGVLGMRTVATIATPDFKHYFFDIGPGNTLAFFQWLGHDVGTIEKPAGIAPDFKTQFDHVSFHLPDEQALLDLSARLVEHACEVTEIIDHGIMKSIYFTDPNGISLEASYRVADATGRPANYGDRSQMFTDADPVPAVVELATAGELAWTPSTRNLGEGADPS
jgi:catechol 2,3-dioxygenase-like lactoylglutathione lyase family enzyme